MHKEKLHKLIIIILSAITTALFFFSLFSGAETINVFNTIPWIILGILISISYKWPVIGGCAITTLGLISIIFFHFYEKGALLGLFTIALPIIILGVALIVLATMKTKKK